MSAFAIVGTALVFTAVGMLGYAWLTAPERRRSRRAFARALRQRDQYRDLYAQSVAREAVHLSRFGGDTPIALEAEVAVAARDIDQEWANLCAQADVERIWGEDE